MSTYLTLQEDKPEGTTHYMYSPEVIVYFKYDSGEWLRWIGYKWVKFDSVATSELIEINSKPKFTGRDYRYLSYKPQGIYTNAKYKGD